MEDLVYINENFEGNALPGDWLNSNATLTVNDKVNFSGAGSLNNYIHSDKGVLNDTSRIEALMIVNALDANSYGLHVGWRSYNEYGYPFHMSAGYVAASGDANFGRIRISANTPNVNLYSPSKNTDVSNGDRLLLTFERKDYTAVVTVVNQGKWTLSFTILMTDHFTPSNSAYPSLVHIGGNVSCDSFKYITGVPDYLEDVIIGDSITQGTGAGSLAKRFAQNVGKRDNNIIMGGGADYSECVVKRIGEINAILDFAVARGDRPRVLLMIGCNDLAAGMSYATIVTNLGTIRNAIVAHGGMVVHLLTTPRPLAYKVIQAIVSTADFLNDLKIDCNTPLSQAGDRETLKPAYNNGDGVHPNPAANAVLANVINAALKASLSVFAGKAIMIVAKQTISFASTGFSKKNTDFIIKIDNPLLSYAPGTTINSIDGFEEGATYLIQTKKDMDIKALAYSTLS